MFASKSLVFTLFFAISFLFAISSAEANVYGIDKLDAHRRAALANRMVKVRQLPGLVGGDQGAVANAGEDPNQKPGGSATDTSTSTTSTSTTSTSTSAASTSTKSSSAATSDTTSSTSSTTSTSVTSTSTTSTSSTSTSSTSTSTSSSTTSTPPKQTAQPNAGTTVLPDNVTLTITGTTSAASETASSADTSSASSTSSVTKTTLTVIIVIASCVGGAAIIWTVIRKWKFRPSAQFEDRMQPIDWQPTLDTNDDPIPGHRRRGSGSSNRSYNSGSDHGMQQSSTGHTGLVSDLPNHDFTAGANLAPMGGYADLARGPSPQPSMQELARGPSMNRGYPAYPQASYDNYGPRY